MSEQNQHSKKKLKKNKTESNNKKNYNIEHPMKNHQHASIRKIFTLQSKKNKSIKTDQYMTEVMKL